MKTFDNILETIGNTPMVLLHKIVADVPATVFAKVETFNPGHSIKDRMALKMVEDAEQKGLLKPGGTIIECTSGNTGMGLALAAIVKGYRCIFTTNDKQSKEKFDILKALGAEVVVCPTRVAPEDPRSYYSVAKKLSEQIPNSFWFNQYDNLSNRAAHYESTGPEIWDQTDGKITHLVVGVGTGGTVSGTARYLKEMNPMIQVWGIDTYGSVFKKYHETGIFDEQEIYPYITEGIGEDILPANVDFDLIDHFEKVSDKDGALAARKLAKQEGILAGYSAGSAMAGLLQLKDRLTADDVVVVILHDHGSRYVGKIYNDEWMRERGFLESDPTISEIIAKKASKELLHVQPDQDVEAVIELMKDKDISQFPVIKDGQVVGSLSDSTIFNAMINGDIAELVVSDIMNDPFVEVSPDLSLNEVTKLITKENPAVLTTLKNGQHQIITSYDLLQAI